MQLAHCKKIIFISLSLAFIQALAGTPSDYPDHLKYESMEAFGKKRSIEFFYDKKNKLTNNIETKIYNPFASELKCMMKDQVEQNGKIIFQSTYSIDEFGLRMTPHQNTKAATHLIIAGDSNTFGVGLQDNETIAFNLQQLFSNKNVINLGFGGTGPNSTLYFLEKDGLSHYLKGHSIQGTFIYQFHFYLIERIIGSKSFVKWGDKLPFYDFSNDGELIYQGNFKNRYQTKFYQFLNKFSVLDKLIPNLPRIGNEHLKLTVEIIKKMKNEYLRQTMNTNKFYLLINQYNDFSPEQYNTFVEMLRHSDIEIIDFGMGLKNQFDEIPNDGHFSSLGAKQVAQKIKLHLNHQTK
jgi:hypothetical protein